MFEKKKKTKENNEQIIRSFERFISAFFFLLSFSFFHRFVICRWSTVEMIVNIYRLVKPWTTKTMVRKRQPKFDIHYHWIKKKLLHWRQSKLFRMKIDEQHRYSNIFQLDGHFGSIHNGPNLHRKTTMKPAWRSYSASKLFKNFGVFLTIFHVDYIDIVVFSHDLWLYF